MKSRLWLVLYLAIVLNARELCQTLPNAMQARAPGACILLEGTAWRLGIPDGDSLLTSSTHEAIGEIGFIIDMDYQDLSLQKQDRLKPWFPWIPLALGVFAQILLQIQTGIHPYQTTQLGVIE